MIIGVPRETYPGERRVALVPVVIPNLIKAGFEVTVETNAGLQAGYPDVQYVEKGAGIVSSRSDLFGKANVILQILSYGSNDITGKEDSTLLRQGPNSDWFSAAIRFEGSDSADRRPRGNRFLGRTCAAYDARPKHGRALFDGYHLRLQGGTDRGR